MYNNVFLKKKKKFEMPFYEMGELIHLIKCIGIWALLTIYNFENVSKYTHTHTFTCTSMS